MNGAGLKKFFSRVRDLAIYSEQSETPGDPIITFSDAATHKINDLACKYIEELHRLARGVCTEEGRELVTEEDILEADFKYRITLTKRLGIFP